MRYQMLLLLFLPCLLPGDLALPTHTVMDCRNWLDLGSPLEITTSKQSDELQVESMMRAIRFKKKLPKGIRVGRMEAQFAAA